MDDNENNTPHPLIGRSIIYKGVIYKILDVHNENQTLVMLDNHSRSMVDIEWENVELLDKIH